MQDFSYPLLSILTYADNGSLLARLRKHCAGDTRYACLSDKEALNSKAITYSLSKKKKNHKRLTSVSTLVIAYTSIAYYRNACL